jgi:hypothetical protein
MTFVPLRTECVLFEELSARRKTLRLGAREDCLLVSIGEQKLWHFRGGSALAAYSISTSRAAPSCIPNSLGTPTGLHQVAEKIGAGEPLGMVFKGRVPQGFHWREVPLAQRGENLITTRILWLEGLEPAHNQGLGCDTHARYIYIHGTNQADKIGSPNSHGCVLLRDADILELFEATPREALVWIGK